MPAQTQSASRKTLPPVELVTCPNCQHEFRPIYPERSARGGQIWVAQSAILMTEVYPKSATVLDYGCGLLRNTHFLAGYFAKANACDTRQQIDRVRHLANSITLFRSGMKEPPQHDVVALIAVLHILPTPEAREAVIRDALRYTTSAGELFIDVPVSDSYYDRNKSRLSRHNDGFVLQSKTFHRSFTHGQVRTLLELSGLDILQWWSLTHHAIARCRKTRARLGWPN